MQIKDGFRALYSEYITKIYPSVAYHDEPKLLKMQELIKLILAVEWLWKKGVRVNQEWIQLHTSESTDGILSKVLLQKRKKLPHEMIPTPSNTNRPTIDVRISTSMASEGKEVVKKSEEQQFYGYYDCNNTEMKIFSETGKLLSHQKSLKISFQHNSYPAIGLYFPIIQSKTQKIKRQLCKPLPKIQKEITDRAPELGDIALERNKSGTVQMKINKVSDSNPLGENTLTVSATMNDDLSGMLAGMNPNDPIPGVCDAIVPPAVSSWDELITEFTVPRPSVWLYSGSGNPVLTTSGGISTRDFPVKTKRLEERVYDRQVEERDIYKKEGHTVTVRAQCVVAQGKIQFVGNSSAEFIRVSQQFTVQWTKGTPPQVKFVFSICNEFLMQNWHSYKQILKSRGHTQEAEDYFHGTELACDLVRTKALCSDGRCGICGISSAGMDSKCISKNSFQRFGQGFYLAPNSSKCDAYGNRNIYGHKAMLLCKVLPGKKFLLSDRQQQLTRPPSGYDSVYGVVGSELNYPEIVIYDQRAVLPKYIIIY